MKHSPVIVIFGITGDLSQRKLLPALYHLLHHGFLDPDTKIIGTSRRPIDENELLSTVELCVLEKHNVCDPAGIQKMKDALSVIQFDPTKSDDYATLNTMLNTFDAAGNRDHLLYMAIPPDAYAQIIDQLSAHAMNDARTRLLIEKPFGEDSTSAQALVQKTNAIFTEQQIYRIDHYLAKETVQNLLTFRIHNPIFTPLWNGSHIEKIHVRAAESIGIENRITFYEQTGALRDVIQGHLLQILAIIMMDQPSNGSSMSIHEGKEALLQSIIAVPKTAIRGQYEGYTSDVDNQQSITETYAKIELKSELASWQDTKIILETGKALEKKITEVVVQFRHPHEHHKNQLHFRIQPNEGISLGLVVKRPGFADKMEHTELDFSYTQRFTDDIHPDAYERVIMDAVRADQSLFASSREVLTSWNIIQPILDRWTKDGNDLLTYPKGTSKPISAS